MAKWNYYSNTTESHKLYLCIGIILEVNDKEYLSKSPIAEYGNKVGTAKISPVIRLNNIFKL